MQTLLCLTTVICHFLLTLLVKEAKVYISEDIMNNVIFTPWVGKFYQKNGYENKKILILGESHYCHKCKELDGIKCWATEKKNVMKENII